jgi:integrase
LLTVRNSLQKVDGKPTLVEPKTEGSRRTLQLPSAVVRSLREHRIRQLEERVAAGRRWKDAHYLFTTRIGTPLDGINVTHSFQAALMAAGLPHQRFHDLRHACATLLLEQGEDLAVVSKLLGHSSFSTTANIYAHLTRDMQRRAADRMDRILMATSSA